MVFMQRQCLGRFSPQRQVVLQHLAAAYSSFTCLLWASLSLSLSLSIYIYIYNMCVRVSVTVRLALNLDPWFSSLCPASIPTYCLDLACSLTVYCMLCPPSPLLLCLASSNLPWVFSAAA